MFLLPLFGAGRKIENNPDWARATSHGQAFPSIAEGFGAARMRALDAVDIAPRDAPGSERCFEVRNDCFKCADGILLRFWIPVLGPDPQGEECHRHPTNGVPVIPFTQLGDRARNSC